MLTDGGFASRYFEGVANDDRPLPNYGASFSVPMSANDSQFHQNDTARSIPIVGYAKHSLQTLKASIPSVISQIEMDRLKSLVKDRKDTWRTIALG